MKWSNLKNNKCPKCNKDFAFGIEKKGHLLTHSCGFQISEQKFNEIVSDRVQRDIALEGPLLDD